VWATPVEDFVGDPTQVDNACGNGCFHGFVPSKSKTDNFKAKLGTPTFCLTVIKEFRKENETSFTPYEGWQINVIDSLGVMNPFYTDANGKASVCGLIPGSYRVQEITYSENDPVELWVNGLEVPPQPEYLVVWSAGKPQPTLLFRNTTVLAPE
jgi:hypothetical protein